VEYLKQSKETEVAFGKLSKYMYVEGVEAGDALFLYNTVDAMREGRSSEVVVEKGIQTVASLCENRDDRAEAHRVMFRKTLDSVPLLLEVMREHQRSEEIARVSFLAVWYLMRTSAQMSPGTRVGCRWKSMAGAFYNATIASLNDDGTYVIHYEDGDQDASVSLNRLRNDEMPRIFQESGGIPLLLEMLEEHGERSADVAKNGLGVLNGLSTNADIKKRIAEAGGTAMILRMLDVQGESNAGVAEKGCGALLNLACNADNQKRIGEEGGIAIILRMLDVQGASNAGVAENGCGALMNLAANADNKSKILAANGCVHGGAHEINMGEQRRRTGTSGWCSPQTPLDTMYLLKKLCVYSTHKVTLVGDAYSTFNIINLKIISFTFNLSIISFF
jgi:hypothetical protein